MTRHVLAMGTQALGWVLIFGALTRALGPTDYAIALTTFTLAQGLASLSVSGFQLARSNRSVSFGYLLSVFLRWVVGSALLLLADQANWLTFFSNSPFSLFALPMISLLLILIRLTVLKGGTGPSLVNLLSLLSPLWLAGLLAGAHVLGSITLEIVLCLMLFAPLSVLGVMLQCRSGRHAHTVSHQFYQQDFATIFMRWADVLTVPFVFGPAAAFTYLFARGVAECVALPIRSLQQSVGPELAQIHVKGGQREFAAISARLNLGIMLIGGAAVLAVISIAPLISDLLGFSYESIHQTLLWLILAQAAPVLFGVSLGLMAASGGRRESQMISLATGIAVLSVIYATHAGSPVEVAKEVAVVHLISAAAAAALLVGRQGIWPGVTAILFRQIKLF